ncbi:MAG TPA: hypothetical protein VHF89_20860 [Solirubrobacteraceae bacterium]|nr:hypothetical protein [Solirubrobacteraceae bacterium]
MSAPGRIATFAAALVLVGAAAALAGGAVDPDRDADDRQRGAKPGGEHAEPAGEHGAGQRQIRGLAVAEDGLRLVVDDAELRPGRRERLAFRIVDDRGVTVRDFDVEHEKRMHLILARRDLTGFQHLHPQQAADGSWTTDVTLDEAGSYRVFADFARDGESHTLGADLRVDGSADLRPLPAPAPTARSDGGYDVALERAGTELRFTITRDGERVETEPYLGAGGHLVVLREGDLAFLHVHPNDDGVAFETELPTPGRYRLFLQFQHEGRVHTVAFTEVVR